jgi:hypothetical protein
LARKALAIYDIIATLDFQPGRENTCICAPGKTLGIYENDEFRKKGHAQGIRPVHVLFSGYLIQEPDRSYAEVKNGSFGMKLKAGFKGRFNPGGVELVALNAQFSHRAEIPK